MLASHSYGWSIMTQLGMQAADTYQGVCGERGEEGYKLRPGQKAGAGSHQKG